jgi:hypothetical protein
MRRIAKKLDFRRKHRVRCVKETIISGQIRVLAILSGRSSLKMKLEDLSFGDRFDILLENEVQQRSWADVYNVIWEIPDKVY